MSLQFKTTCDVCGSENVSGPQDNAVFAFGATRPYGWLTVAATAAMIGTAEPKRSPDLCGWLCVAAYAAERAGATVVINSPGDQEQR